MAINITPFLTANNSNIAHNFLGGVLLNSAGLIFVLLLALVIFLIVKRLLEQNYPAMQSLFIAFLVTFIPAVLLRLLEFFNLPAIPDWWIALHLTLVGVFGVLSYIIKR